MEISGVAYRCVATHTSVYQSQAIRVITIFIYRCSEIISIGNDAVVHFPAVFHTRSIAVLVQHHITIGRVSVDVTIAAVKEIDGIDTTFPVAGFKATDVFCNAETGVAFVAGIIDHHT